MDGPVLGQDLGWVGLDAPINAMESEVSGEPHETGNPVGRRGACRRKMVCRRDSVARPKYQDSCAEEYCKISCFARCCGHARVWGEKNPYTRTFKKIVRGRNSRTERQA